MALVIDIADAVVAELREGTFSQSFTPLRRVSPQYDIAELAVLRVTVVPASMAISSDSRMASRHDVQIDVGIQKKLGRSVDDDIAPLCNLVDEIGEFLKRRRLSQMPQVLFLSLTNDPIYAVEHLVDNGVFTSVLRITYRALR